MEGRLYTVANAHGLLTTLQSKMNIKPKHDHFLNELCKNGLKHHSTCCGQKSNPNYCLPVAAFAVNAAFAGLVRFISNK